MTDAETLPRLRARVVSVEERLMAWLSDLGERRDLDWLTYNPLRMRMFHRYAVRDAPAVMATLQEAFARCNSFVDVGCGSGAYAAEAQRRGLHVVGCERSRVGRMIARRQGVHCKSFDLSREPATDVDERFDLAYCLEVAEHLPEALGLRLVAFLSRIAPVVVFTAAAPGQGGTGHVNEQPKAYWRAAFRRCGMEAAPLLSDTVRAGFESHGVQARWLIDNVDVYLGAAAVQREAGEG